MGRMWLRSNRIVHWASTQYREDGVGACGLREIVLALESQKAVLPNTSCSGLLTRLFPSYNASSVHSAATLVH